MRVRLMAPLLVVVALVGACSGDEEQPRALPSAAPTTAAPTPTAGPVPTEAQAETPQGAAAFARFFYAEVQRAYELEDPAVVERLSAPGCEACRRFVASLTAIRDDGQSVTPVIYEIISAEAPAITGPEARVDVIYDSPEIVRRDAGGAVISTEPAVQNYQEQLSLVRAGSRWLVQEVTAV